MTVQLGLAYMKEDDGPIADLLCAVKIIPRMMDIKPAIVIVLPISFFTNIMTSVTIEKSLCEPAIAKIICDIIFDVILG